MAYPNEASLAVTPGSGTSVAGYMDLSGNFRQTIVLGDPYFNAALIPVGVQIVSLGGNQTSAAITSGKNTITVIANAPSFLCQVLVTTSNTAQLTFYDNASAASGTVIGIVPANATVGSLYSFQMPALNGITASASANNPAVTVSFVSDTYVDVS